MYATAGHNHPIVRGTGTHTARIQGTDPETGRWTDLVIGYGATEGTALSAAEGGLRDIGRDDVDNVPADAVLYALCTFARNRVAAGATGAFDDGTNRIVVA